MIYTAIFLALIAPILAQSNWTIPAGFDLAQVDSSTRANWCLGQRNNCPKICGGAARINNCESDTLEFTCTCSNGTDANVAPYEGTIPFFVCQENYRQCILQSNTQEGDEVCTDGLNQCGSLNASAPTTTSSSSTPSATQSSETGASSNDDQSGSEPTTTDSSDSPTETDGAMRLMQNYGLAGFATVVVAAFALL
ncbi:hypothetical protein BDW62DRAFT_179451 [Aspergillus aurantiobrunneus]